MTVQPNAIAVDRYWFLTWTTYGSWLPGDDRGSTGTAPDETGKPVDHNVFGMPSAPPNSPLRDSVARNLKASTFFLSGEQAEALLTQVNETARFRDWLPVALAIMPTHVHLVIGVPGDPDPEKILGDLKAYCSRRLNHRWHRPVGGNWWTKGGSKRKLANESAVEAAIHYVRQQQNPLLIWTRESGRLV